VSDAEYQLYCNAQQLATIAMGRITVGRGRGAKREWAASEDPGAWWELTECIVSIAKRHAANVAAS
jgi:hypothetical protein